MRSARGERRLTFDDILLCSTRSAVGDQFGPFEARPCSSIALQLHKDGRNRCAHRAVSSLRWHLLSLDSRHIRKVKGWPDVFLTGLHLPYSAFPSSHPAPPSNAVVHISASATGAHTDRPLLRLALLHQPRLRATSFDSRPQLRRRRMLIVLHLEGAGMGHGFGPQSLHLGRLRGGGFGYRGEGSSSTED